jgi:glycosyltransferase involved in cell wall biosynthesis
MLNGEGAEVVERSRSGVTCRAGDAAGLAAAVLHLAALSESQRGEMGRNALAVCADEFDRSRLITELETWLEQLRVAAGRRRHTSR